MPSGKSIQARGIDPDVVLKPEGKEGEDSHADYAEALPPGHLRGDEEIAGSNAGDVLEGDAPIAAALAELKKPAGPDRKGVVWGKRGSVRVDHGGRRTNKKKRAIIIDVTYNTPQ